jgi:hypothetical protein
MRWISMTSRKATSAAIMLPGRGAQGRPTQQDGAASHVSKDHPDESGPGTLVSDETELFLQRARSSSPHARSAVTTVNSWATSPSVLRWMNT